MQQYEVGYVPNLSARIGAVRAGDSVSYPVYFGGANGVRTFRAAYENSSWFALSFAFTRQFRGDFYEYSYAGFSVDNLTQWAGNYQQYTHWAGTLISDWDFVIGLKEVFSTRYQFTFVAVYETMGEARSLLDYDFEEIEI